MGVLTASGGGAFALGGAASQTVVAGQPSFGPVDVRTTIVSTAPGRSNPTPSAWVRTDVEVVILPSLGTGIGQPSES